jgi:hypothetical protein
MTGTQPPAARRQDFSWGDFFAFRVMVTPVLIRLVYLIGVVLITLAAIAIPLFGTATTVCTGTADGGAVVCQPIQGALLGGLLAGVLVFVIGQLYFRVVMELLMVIFGIHESVRAIEARDPS